MDTQKNNSEEKQASRQFGGFNSDPSQKNEELNKDRNPRQDQEDSEEDTQNTPQNFKR